MYRIEDEATHPVSSQDWVKQLYEELEKQRLSLSERYFDFLVLLYEEVLFSLSFYVKLYTFRS